MDAKKKPGAPRIEVPPEILTRIDERKLIDKYGGAAAERIRRYKAVRAKEFARLVAAGCSIRALARVFSVGPTDVVRWAKQGKALLDTEAATVNAAPSVR
jgi:hypothetical protein